MKHHRALSFCVFCLLATAAPQPAWSQAPALGSDAASAQADDLTHRGVELLKQHQWVEAEALFRQALALKRSYDIVGNLGLAEAGLGKWRDATEHLTFALGTFPANGKAAHRDLLRDKLATARAHVGGLTIQVDVAGAEVIVDHKSVGRAPLAGEVFVEPGTHVVDAQLAGREGARQEVTVAAGGAENVKLTLPETPTPPPTPTPPRTSWRPGTAWIVAGGVLAAGGLAAGLGLTFAGKSKASDANAQLAAVQNEGGTFACSTGSFSSDCAALRSANRTADTLSNASAAGYTVAGVGGAAVLTYLLWPAKKADQGTVITPIVGSGVGGIAFSGRF